MSLIWSDDFVDSDGVELEDHIPDVGGSYVFLAGNVTQVQIQSNELSLVTANSTLHAYRMNGLPNDNMDLSWSMIRTGAQTIFAGFRFRANMLSTPFLGARVTSGSGGLLFIEAIGNDSNNTFTLQVPFSWPVDTWITVRVKVKGSTVTVWRNGVFAARGFIPFAVTGGSTIWRFQRGTTSTLRIDSLFINSVEMGVSGMIYVADVPLMIPTEGTEQILNALRSALCAGCPAGIGAGDPAATTPPLGDLTMVLNTNAVDPSAGLSFADLVPTDDAGGAPVEINGEAAPDYCIDGFEGPAVGGDGFWRLLVDQQIFTAAGGGTTPPVITGVALVLNGDTLLAYGPLPDGPANFEEDDVVKVSAQLTLRPQLLLP